MDSQHIPKLYELCINSIRKKLLNLKNSANLNPKSKSMISYGIHKDLEYMKETVPDDVEAAFSHSLSLKVLPSTQTLIFSLELTEFPIDVKDLYLMCDKLPHLSHLKLLKIISTEKDPYLPFSLNNVNSFSLLDFDDSILLNSLFLSGFCQIKSLQLFSQGFSEMKTSHEFFCYALRCLMNLEKVNFDNIIVLNFAEFALNLNNPHVLRHFSYTNSKNVPGFSCDCTPLVRVATNLKFLDLSGCLFDQDALSNELSGRRLNFLNIFSCPNIYGYSKFNASLIGGDAHLDNVINAIFYFEDKEDFMIKALHYIQNFPFPIKTSLYKRFLRFACRLFKTVKKYEIIAMLMFTMSIRLSCQALPVSHRGIIYKATLPVARNNFDNQKIMTGFGYILIHLEPWKYPIFMPGLCDMFLIIMKSMHFHDSSIVTFTRLNNILSFAICDCSLSIKTYLGLSGCIELAMNYINRAVKTHIDQNIKFEPWWSFLWNITDETEENVMLIVNNGGLELAVQCFEMCSEDDDVIRSIVGTMGNIAEVKEARRFMGTSGIIKQLFHKLNRSIYTFETSYNACGALCNLLSDPDDVLKTYVYPDMGDVNPRDVILVRIKELVLSWPIGMHRHINYRSLAPIVRLLNEELDERIWLWALWACANLTSYNLNKYMPMLMSTNALVRIEIICVVYNPELPDFRDFADVCNRNYQAYISQT